MSWQGVRVSQLRPDVDHDENVTIADLAAGALPDQIAELVRRPEAWSEH